MAQVLYTLPVSLFGMSVSAAELPAMSSATGTNEARSRAALRARLEAGLRRIAFFVVPSAAAFLAFGGVIAGALFQTGRFTAADSEYVWAILAGSAIGLLAATLGRLYSSAYYALSDTRTPLRFAIIRVVLTTVLGLSLRHPAYHRSLGSNRGGGPPDLTASAGLAGWVEFILLGRGLRARIGIVGLATRHLVRLWSAAAIAAGLAFGVRLLLPPTLSPVRSGWVDPVAVWRGLPCPERGPGVSRGPTAASPSHPEWQPVTLGLLPRD